MRKGIHWGGISVFCLLIFVGGVYSAPVSFSINFTDSLGSGFYDPTLGAARRSAFEYACGIWSDHLEASYVGETIAVAAGFEALGGDESSATLGSAGPETLTAANFGSSGGDLWLNAANANHWYGGDQTVGTPEIRARFNSDVDNSTVLGETDFYYGLDGNSGADVDFVTVLLHEIGHGLGFTSLIDPASGAYTTLDGSIPNTPTIYDYFLGQDNGDGSYTPLVDMTDADRLDATIAQNIFWIGSDATAANGGVPVQIHAPATWEKGSSIAHLDQNSQSEAIMSPYYSGVSHTPDALTLGMLSDVGWTVIPEPSTVVLLALFSFGMVAVRRFFSM